VAIVVVGNRGSDFDRSEVSRVNSETRVEKFDTWTVICEAPMVLKVRGRSIGEVAQMGIWAFRKMRPIISLSMS
jgi:hypothetical protein